MSAEVSIARAKAGFAALVATRQCSLTSALPMHHRNPFDRMLIAQAQGEQVPLLARDRAMTAYAEQATILRFPEA